jgi:hypothetical protein
MLLEKPTSNAMGSWGESARATREREHISVNHKQKLAALHGIHDSLEHLALQNAFQHQASRRQLKEAPYDTEIKTAFRSQGLSG